MHALTKQDVLTLTPTKVRCDHCGALPLSPCRVKGKTGPEWEYVLQVHWARVHRRDGYLDGFEEGMRAAAAAIKAAAPRPEGERRVLKRVVT